MGFKFEGQQNSEPKDKKPDVLGRRRFLGGAAAALAVSAMPETARAFSAEEFDNLLYQLIDNLEIDEEAKGVLKQSHKPYAELGISEKMRRDLHLDTINGCSGDQISITLNGKSIKEMDSGEIKTMTVSKNIKISCSK